MDYQYGMGKVIVEMVSGEGIGALTTKGGGQFVSTFSSLYIVPKNTVNWLSALDSQAVCTPREI